MYSDKDRLHAIGKLAIEICAGNYPSSMKRFAQEVGFLAEARDEFLQVNKNKFPTLKEENEQ